MPSATSYPISPCGEPDGVGLPDRHGSPNGYGSPDGYGRPDGHGYPDGHGSVDGHESPNGHRSLAGHEGSDGDSDSPALAGISSSTKRPHRHSSPETFPPHPRSIGLRGSPTPIPPFSSSSQPNKHRLDPPLSQKISPASEAYPARTPRSNSGSGQSGEDTLTLRRREANRLAAQRFRSRKKGYQDSLEERVRQLEDERDALLHRLGEVPGPSSRGTLGIGFDEDAYDSPGPQHTRPMAASPTSRTVPQSHFSARSASPERLELSIDNDIRTAALEAANRKLQDKLRRIADENERMGAEIERWQRWERDQRECQPWKYAFRESDQRVSRGAFHS